MQLATHLAYMGRLLGLLSHLRLLTQGKKQQATSLMEQLTFGFYKSKVVNSKKFMDFVKKVHEFEKNSLNLQIVHQFFKNNSQKFKNFIYFEKKGSSILRIISSIVKRSS